LNDRALRLFDCAISEHVVDLSCVCLVCAAVIHQSELKMMDLVFDITFGIGINISRMSCVCVCSLPTLVLSA
jgi:hypothetical protein